MTDQKKKKIQVAEISDEDLALEQMSQVFLENLKELPRENADAFDKYSDIIRMHFYSRLPNFESRLISGYHNLQKEISTTPI